MSTAKTTRLDPLIHEFDTEEEAQSYDRWFRAKVQEALDSKEPCIPHDELVKEMAFIADSRRKNRADT